MKEIKLLTPAEQRQLFEDRGIIFFENCHEHDIKKIQEIGYYKLKEFASAFADDNNENIKYNNLTFENLILRYYQDKNLRIYIFHAIEVIEVYLNNVVATLLGKYNAFGYLEFKNWCNRDKLSKFQIEKKQFYFKNDLLNKIKRSSLPDLQNPDYKNCDGFPIVWLMTDCLTLGDTVHLVMDMSTNNQNLVAKKFNCRRQELLSWLKCINFIRNECVHNEDLLDLILATKPLVVSQFKDEMFDEANKNDRISSIIFIIKYLINHIDNHYEFTNIYNTLNKIINHNDSTAQKLGFKNANSIECLIS